MTQAILHHGRCSREFTPTYIGTDYFSFYHTPCSGDAAHHGACTVTAILIDHQARVIFNLQCLSCGARDALKTAAHLWNPNPPTDPLRVFHLSPHLKNRVKRHRWDDQ